MTTEEQKWCEEVVDDLNLAYTELQGHYDSLMNQYQQAVETSHIQRREIRRLRNLIIDRAVEDYQTELNARKRAIGVANHDHVLGSDDVCHYCAEGLPDV